VSFNSGNSFAVIVDFLPERFSARQPITKQHGNDSNRNKSTTRCNIDPVVNAHIQ